MHSRPGPFLLLALALLMGAAACSSGASSSHAPTTIPQPSVAAFCKVAKQVDGNHKASYAGSAQNLADVVRLEQVAPAAVRPDIEIYRAFIAAGGIDSNKRSTAEVANFPANVQAASNASSAYITANC